MKRFPVFLGVILFIIGSTSLCFGDSVTVSDGDFSDWSFDYICFENEYGTANVDVVNTEGNPVPCLANTTHSGGFPEYTTVYGVAIKNDFVWDPATQGAITAITMNLDYRGTGGRQNVVIIVFQAGQYYLSRGSNT